MKNTLIPAVLATAAIAHAKLTQRHPLTVQVEKGWTSLGCYSDTQSSRTLANITLVGEGVSDTTCQSNCKRLGYLYAGTEYSGQCYCDNSINPVATQQPDSDCSMACRADSTQPCGGPDRINVFTYKNNAKANYNVPGWNYVACYADNVAQRGLSVKVDAGGESMTPATCTAACYAKGYTLAGMEYGDECYCDNYIQNGQSPIDELKCNSACAGDNTLVCGGAAAMSLFAASGTTPTAATVVAHDPTIPSDWTTLGCYTDDVGKRALANYIAAPSTGMTVEYCIATARSAGYTFAGVEYSGECFADTQINHGQGPASDGNAGCNMQCSGDSGETCGGAGRLNLYSVKPAAAPKTKTTGLASGWSYQGCFSDLTDGRILALRQDSDTLTAEQCIATCTGLGYVVAGLEFHNQCFCGNAIMNYAGLATTCSQACSGDSSETCGGAGSVDIYSNGQLQYVYPPKEQTTGLPSGWSYDGCFTDSVSTRDFSHELDQANATPSTCMTYCQGEGYSIAGVEYGNQCYCGSSSELAAFTTASNICDMPCAGDSTIACGGRGAIDIYTLTAH